MIKREWNPPWFIKQLIRLAPWGFPRQILMILEEKERTLPEIINALSRFMRHFGHFGQEQIVAGYSEELLTKAILKALKDLGTDGYVVQKEKIFILTPRGRKKARQHKKEYVRMGRGVEKLLNPQTVSLVGLGVHIVLAVIKLLAGFISGSIGLITDGVDTSLDGFSSILVYIGLRLKKEQIINIILVFLMLVVGIIAGIESAQRIFIPEEIEVNFLTFAVAFASGLICFLLSLYQRYVAIRSKQQALIAQAVDSHNHTIVASGVIIGLVAALLDFPLLDTSVGLIVALLILKSGIELALDTIRTLRGEEMNFYCYELGFIEEYRNFQKKQLSDWLQYIISQNKFKSRQELIIYCNSELNTQDVPILRELGYRKSAVIDREINNTLDVLIEKGLLSKREGMNITKKALDASVVPLISRHFPD